MNSTLRQPFTGRPYRRHTRKAACKLCSARHIRCESPESPAPGEDRRESRSRVAKSRQCRGCRVANKRCERLEVPEDEKRQPQRVRLAKKAQLHDASSGTSSASAQGRQRFAAIDANHLSRIISASQAVPDSAVEIQADDHFGSENGKEGTEMLFLRLVEPRPQNPEEYGPGDRVVCFGEHSSWSYTIQEVRSPAGRREPSSCQKPHYSIPDSIGQRAHNLPDFNTDNPTEDEFYLRHKRAFTLPPSDVQAALLDTYFRWQHPSHQVFDADEFQENYQAGNVSLLLLNAVFFIAAVHCDECLVKDHFETRHAAQLTFFNRAKMLFNTDYEPNPVANIQSLFLMSFWWGGPTDQKDHCHWLGAAITLAQGRGMHRSTAGSNMSLKDRRLWRRIWWALYIRDQSDAAAHGRPTHIHDDDCDVEMLVESDFDDSSPGSLLDSPARPKSHALYIMHTARLFVLLHRITKHKSSCRQHNAVNPLLTQQLEEWAELRPSQIIYRDDLQDPDNRLWAAILEVKYNFCLILLHRPAYIVAHPTKSNDSPAILAANKMTRVIEDLLVSGLIRFAPVYIIPSLFAALTIHITYIRRSTRLECKLAHQKAQLCLLALDELRDSWPIAGWIAALFESIMRQLSGEEPSSSDQRFFSTTTPVRGNTPKGRKNPTMSPVNNQHVQEPPCSSFPGDPSQMPVHEMQQLLPNDALTFGSSIDDFNSFGFVEAPFWYDWEPSNFLNNQ